MSVDQRWWIGGRAHGLHGSWVLQLGWSWGLLEADEFGVPFKIMGRDKIKQEHHSWPSEVQIKQINAPCFLRFLHQDWIEFCKSANPWKIYWRYCVHQCSRICFLWLREDWGDHSSFLRVGLLRASLCGERLSRSSASSGSRGSKSKWPTCSDGLKMPIRKAIVPS